MLSRSTKPFLVAHINFVKGITDINDLRHVHSLFGSIKAGKLVHWKDYLTTAGFMHHGGHSMAVYDLSSTITLKKSFEESYEDWAESLRRITGVVSPYSWEQLQSGTNEVHARPKNARYNVDPLIATLEDPFFRAANMETARRTRLDFRDCIPMTVAVQQQEHQLRTKFAEPLVQHTLR